MTKLYSHRLCGAIFLCCALTLACAHAATSRAAAVLDSMPRAKNIENATISPDGRQVAYVLGGELSVVAASGGESHGISIEGKLPVRDIAWSPDSKQLVFLTDLPGDVPSAQLWTAA